MHCTRKLRDAQEWPTARSRENRGGFPREERIRSKHQIAAPSSLRLHDCAEIPIDKRNLPIGFSLPNRPGEDFDDALEVTAVRPEGNPETLLVYCVAVECIIDPTPFPVLRILYDKDSILLN